MRISDWSSDVCSSDLPPGRGGDPCYKAHNWFLFLYRFEELGGIFFSRTANFANHNDAFGLRIAQEHLQAIDKIGATDREIGRASCRESVCQYVSISVDAGSLKKQKK